MEETRVPGRKSGSGPDKWNVYDEYFLNPIQTFVNIYLKPRKTVKPVYKDHLLK